MNEGSGWQCFLLLQCSVAAAAVCGLVWKNVQLDVKERNPIGKCFQYTPKLEDDLPIISIISWEIQRFCGQWELMMDERQSSGWG
jgi:hypothetical protein